MRKIEIHLYKNIFQAICGKSDEDTESTQDKDAVTCLSCLRLLQPNFRALEER